MKDKLRKITLKLFTYILLICVTLILVQTEELHASDSVDSVLRQKVSQSYTRKFCNSIGFGLSKESAMKFSLNENNQVFNKRKGYKNLNKELLAEEIAISVIDKCGYTIKLSGEGGVEEFKNYYLSQDGASSGN